MPTVNVSLSEHSRNMIAAGIKDGRFADASEAVEAGLRLLEGQAAEDEVKLAWLREAVQAGIDELDSCKGTTFQSIDELAAYLHELGNEASRELMREQSV